MEAKARLLDWGLIRLVRHGPSDQWLLSHTVTETKMWLPPASGGYSLAVPRRLRDLVSGGQADFAAELLPVTLLSTPKGIVVVEGERVQLLPVYTTEHKLQTLDIGVGGRRMVPVDTFKFQHLWGGAFFYWSLPSLFAAAACGLACSEPAWLQNRWVQWHKWLLGLGMSECHLRKGAPDEALAHGGPRPLECRQKVPRRPCLFLVCPHRLVDQVDVDEEGQLAGQVFRARGPFVLAAPLERLLGRGAPRRRRHRGVP